MKSVSIVKLAQIPEGPELREAGWISVNRLVRYPWPLDRQIAIDASPLEGWSWAELFKDEAEPTRKSVLRRREVVRAQGEVAKASLGEAVAGFWQSNLGNLGPDRVNLGLVTLQDSDGPAEVRELVGVREEGRLKFRGLYRNQDGLLTVWPTDRPCLARIVGSRMLGVVSLEPDGTLTSPARNLLATRGLTVNVVQPHSSILQEPERVLHVEQNQQIEHRPVGSQEDYLWPDRAAPEYGKELVRQLEEKRGEEYSHLNDSSSGRSPSLCTNAVRGIGLKGVR